LGPGVNSGYPPTGSAKVTMEANEDGFIFLPAWATGSTHYPDPVLPCTKNSITELFTMWNFSALPMATDSEELWQKTGVDYRPEMAIVHGTNPVMSCGDQKAMEDLYKKIPFIVAFGLLPSEFEEGFANIVLPDICYLEASVAGNVRGKFDGPPGVLDWCCSITQPVVKPDGQIRPAMEVAFEICRRLGITDKFNASLNSNFRLVGEHKLIQDERVDIDELCDRSLKEKFGEEYDWEWFKQNGFLRYPKQVEDAYWRWFKDVRVPIYFEWIGELGEKIKEKAESVGIHMDWEAYTPLVSWYPTPPIKEQNPEYDLYCFSYRDILHTGSMTMEQQWLDEASLMNPYSYTITMNTDTAMKKGLKDGDTIWVENTVGRKQKGLLKLINGQHPQTIAIAACSGHWIDGLPIAKGKGTNFDDLMPIDLEHIDPVSGNLEVSVKVRVYPANKETK
ncbi:MAG: hypothetical protein KAI94_09050, partial [Anaerolineales bacterium]|nr:hypothetical protein [Anaerolineales bacterium]